MVILKLKWKWKQMKTKNTFKKHLTKKENQGLASKSKKEKQ